jgi:ketosteroid isomerase-like protein
MNKSFTNLITCLLIILSLSTTAQTKPSPAEKFFEYYNAHDEEKLGALLADDFVWNIRFINKNITKKELLGPYMRYYKAFNVGYTTIAVIMPGNPQIITVHEYSDKDRILQLDDPGWSFLIESKNGKITSIIMDGLKGLDDYMADSLRKEELFRAWVDLKK